MKNLLLPSFFLLAFGLLLNACDTEESDAATPEEAAGNEPTAAGTASPDNPIEGAWELVWGQYGDQVQAPAEPFQIKLFTDRHMAFIGERAGKWDFAVAGTYELDGNIYRETAGYSLDEERKYQGTTLEWHYEVRGDSLIMSGPVKITPGPSGEALEVPLNSMQEVRVRAQ